MRHTRSATRTVIVIGDPLPAASTLKIENGRSVTVARRKMMVSAASKMSSAISLGVFWRLAPSTIAIMRSRNVSPGLAVMRTIEPVGEDARAARHGAAIAAALADDGRALASDGALVDRRDALDDLAVARDEIAGLDDDEVALAELRCRTGLVAASRRALGDLLGLDVLAGLAQRVGLRLAAPLGHRLGEVREEHREPQPERDREDEPRRRLALPRRAPGRREPS